MKLTDLLKKVVPMGHVTWWPLLEPLSWYPLMLSSLCNSFEDQAPIDEMGAQTSNELQWLNLTHCGLMTAYGGRDLGQHWFRQWLVAWRHQTITWTNVDLSSLRSSDVYLRAISKPPVNKISLKIIFLRFYWNLPGANELIGRVPD